jgi:hypothetical protein
LLLVKQQKWLSEFCVKIHRVGRVTVNTHIFFGLTTSTKCNKTEGVADWLPEVKVKRFHMSLGFQKGQRGKEETIVQHEGSKSTTRLKITHQIGSSCTMYL